MPQKSANGKARGSITSAVGGLKLPPTDFLDLDTIWIEMIIPNQANQLFRARMMELRDRGIDINTVKFDMASSIDDDGKMSEKMITVIHTCFIKSWGDWDAKGNRQTLYDDDGDVSECTLENFTDVVRNYEGGDALFLAIQEEVIKKSAAKVVKAGLEKNSSRTSRERPTKGTRSSTQKGQKPATA